jgi:regulator of nucleoside diphosphate kinase
MTATATTNIATRPPIVLGDVDYKRLSALADAAFDRLPDLAEELQTELDRARVVSSGGVPDNVVQMGSTVEFRSDAGINRRVTLVYPDEADIAADRVSVLTPIGAALIGLALGQSMRWTARDGRTHELTVVAVEQPAVTRLQSA